MVLHWEWMGALTLLVTPLALVFRPRPRPAAPGARSGRTPLQSPPVPPRPPPPPRVAVILPPLPIRTTADPEAFFNQATKRDLAPYPEEDRDRTVELGGDRLLHLVSLTRPSPKKGPPPFRPAPSDRPTEQSLAAVVSAYTDSADRTERALKPWSSAPEGEPVLLVPKKVVPLPSPTHPHPFFHKPTLEVPTPPALLQAARARRGRS